ncbi:MAG: ATP-binding cassette domain-containing protein [Oscillospiraceae bacterium]|nr:ATP-binding cassette domain-containing protein [Oscillospiraceae bacterium]
MLTTENLGVQFGGQVLFQNADLVFKPGNCYGIIGANGAGKSTLLKVLAGELESTKGYVHTDPKERLSVLRQDQSLYDDHTVLETVIMGNQRLFDIAREKDAIYSKEDFSDEDGLRAAELEGEFAEMGGWEAESDAARLLQGLGIPAEYHEQYMRELEGRLKVKVLLAQALFGQPDIVLLDEPTNNLDLPSTIWLENFLMDYEGTVLVVSHDRYFLNNVCTHIVDIDYGKIRQYVGNYDFWYESSQLMQKLIRDQNRKAEQKIAELQAFISRFAANASKSRQATSRKRLLEKITLEEIPASSRRYPWVGFKAEREPGKDRLTVTDVSKTVNGVKVLNHVSFTMGKEDKIGLLSDNEIAITTLFQILAGELEPDEGTVKWGVSTTQSYMPREISGYFDGCDLELMDWMAQFSENKRPDFLRPFLGRMLFSGNEVYKKVSVLSGGERVRCMLSKMMLEGRNVLMFDQPTNHLDLESIQALNNGISAFPHNVILYSHDHQLMESVVNRMIELTPEGCIDRRCSFDEYMHWSGRDGAAET